VPIVAILGVVAAIGLVLFAINGNTQAAVSDTSVTVQVPEDVTQAQVDVGITVSAVGQLSEITTDPNTWPTGDGIWDICQAIAMAEGYNVANSVPFRLNNPGDISDGHPPYVWENHSGSSVTVFPDAATGWNWLYRKISNHVEGLSSVYPKSLTIEQFSQKYAGNSVAWMNNVIRDLGVSPSSTFADYVNA
jgi:hypothetical protein